MQFDFYSSFFPLQSFEGSLIRPVYDYDLPYMTSFDHLAGAHHVSLLRINVKMIIIKPNKKNRRIPYIKGYLAN
jgi:hypothetical protein